MGQHRTRSGEHRVSAAVRAGHTSPHGEHASGRPSVVRSLDSPTDIPFPWEDTADDGKRPVWRRAAEGFVAGVVATAVMTGFRIGAKKAGLMDRRPPHSEVVGRLRAITGHAPWGRRAERTATIAHYAFGGVAGAVYGVVGPRRARPAGGVAFAGALWAISYVGVFPRIGLMPSPVAGRHRSAGRHRGRPRRVRPHARRPARDRRPGRPTRRDRARPRGGSCSSRWADVR